MFGFYTEIPHVGTFAGQIGSQAIQQILCGGKGDAPGCARCWVGTYRLSLGCAPFLIRSYIWRPKSPSAGSQTARDRDPSTLLCWPLTCLCWVWFILYKQPGTGPQHPKMRRPNCSNFDLALWATFPVFRCAMEVRCLLHERRRCLAVLTIE